MASLTDIRAGLAANLGALTNVQVSAYQLANPSLPSVQVMGPDEIVFHRAMGSAAHDEWTVTVQALVALTTDIGAQKLLDAMVDSAGAQSVKAAIESDKTLGGACRDLLVERMTGYRVFQVDGRGPAIGAEWTVRILG